MFLFKKIPTWTLLVISSFILAVLIAIIGSLLEKPSIQKVEIIDEWKKCDNTSECVETQDGCCNCNSGGGQTAINKDYLEDWENLIETNCKNMACLAYVACEQGVIVCKNYKCEFDKSSSLIIQ